MAREAREYCKEAEGNIDKVSVTGLRGSRPSNALRHTWWNLHMARYKVMDPVIQAGASSKHLVKGHQKARNDQLQVRVRDAEAQAPKR